VTLLALVCLIGLLSGLGLAFWQWQQAERWRRTAQEALIRAAQVETAAAAEKKAAAAQIELLGQAQSKLEQSFRALARKHFTRTVKCFSTGRVNRCWVWWLPYRKR
jgi:DNA anti-recombination protein RmuC